MGCETDNNQPIGRYKNILYTVIFIQYNIMSTCNIILCRYLSNYKSTREHTREVNFLPANGGGRLPVWDW